jgi:hypothetical protein
LHFDAQAGSLRYHDCPKNYIQKDFLLTRGLEYFNLKKVEGSKNANLWGPVLLF